MSKDGLIKQTNLDEGELEDNIDDILLNNKIWQLSDFLYFYSSLWKGVGRFPKELLTG